MSESLKLYHICGELAAIDQILQENGGELTPEIEAELEQWTGHLSAKAENIVLYLEQHLETEKERGRKLEEAGRAHRKRQENIQHNIKEYMRRCLLGAGIPKVKAGVYTVSVQQGRESLVIEDVMALPADCREVVVEHKPLKDRIKDRLKGGDEVSGARLERGAPFLVVR